MKITKQDSERFRLNINKNPTVGNLECWVWAGAMSGRYGTFWFGGNQIRAHRFSFLLYKGQIPDGKIVMHKCDNCWCVNPKHLNIGTQRENLLDCVSKGRHVTQTKPETLARGDRNGTHTMPETVCRGTSHGMSKLTAEKVILARKLSAGGMSNVKIAKKFKLCSGTIDAVISGRSWKHI